MSLCKRIKYKFWVALFIIAVINAEAQISPGELTKAHEHLEGIKNCTKCHVLGEKETTSKCLECHTEIQQLITANHGYHASVEVKGKKCAECHGEHFGREFEMVRFNTETFNHQITGYILEGKHAELECISCHKPELIKNPVSQKKGQTFLGLETNCLSCHADYHQNTLSQNCVSCHNQSKFRPATGFNHAQTNFPLIGKHIAVDCKKCHKITLKNNAEFQEFSGIKFENCTRCHTDVHQNKFGNDCRKCHDEFSFTQVKSMGTFNHDNTNFPLEGKHKNLDCKKCHKSSLTQPVKHRFCTDCHLDYHEKQFQKNGISPDCSACHNVNFFTPSDFTITKHNQTDFKLEGAHLATPCFSCHKKQEKWIFSSLGKTCISCHENVHKKHISEKYIPENNCSFCHSVEVWNEISFNHSLTNFELLGEHKKANCRACHFKEIGGLISQKFKELGEQCESCHQDIHFRQFAENGENRCERCHTFNNWKPEKFDHNKARFILDGEHAGLDCVKCHKPTDGLIQNYIVYKFEDITCAACH